MKIVSQDFNVLVAVDKAYGNLVAGVVMGVGGVSLLIMGFGTHQTALMLIGIGVLLAGAAIVAFRKVRTLSIDKGAGQIILELKGLIGGGSQQYAVSDVVKVEFTTSYQTTTTGTNAQPRTGVSFGTRGIGMNGNTQTTQQTQVHLVLKDGTVIDLADGQRSMSALGVFSKVPNLEVAQQIAAFLGVPFEQQGPASIDQAVSAVRGAIMDQTNAPSVVPAQQVQSPPPTAETTQPTNTQTPQ